MSRRRLLLCTDMDRTVIPNGSQPETPGSREWFLRLCQDQRICLVYVTGRDKRLVKQALAEYQLPVPDFAITDVGSMIYQINDAIWEPVALWQQEIAEAWHGFGPTDIARQLTGIRGLNLQEEDKQKPFKLSYYCDLVFSSADVLDAMAARLKTLGIAANLIWSVDEIAKVGLVDVLPENADKFHALNFLASYLGYDEPELLFAGDSGNDLSVLNSSISSILVANGHPDVHEAALAAVAANGYREGLFIAGPDHWPGNGNYCSGVLQGVFHFYPELRTTIKRIVS